MKVSEPGYKVVWPLGKSDYSTFAVRARPADLNGKTVCELSDFGFRAEEIFPIIRESLKKRYAGIKFVEYSTFGNIHGSNEAEVIANLPHQLKKHGCDVVISGVGG